MREIYSGLAPAPDRRSIPARRKRAEKNYARLAGTLSAAPPRGSCAIGRVPTRGDDAAFGQADQRSGCLQARPPAFSRPSGRPSTSTAPMGRGRSPPRPFLSSRTGVGGSLPLSPSRPLGRLVARCSIILCRQSTTQEIYQIVRIRSSVMRQTVFLATPFGNAGPRPAVAGRRQAADNVADPEQDRARRAFHLSQGAGAGHRQARPLPRGDRRRRVRSACAWRSTSPSTASTRVLLDEDDKASEGSRAICFAKRTLEILDRLGVRAARGRQGRGLERRQGVLPRSPALPVRPAARVGPQAPRLHQPAAVLSRAVPGRAAAAHGPRRSALAQPGRRRRAARGWRRGQRRALRTASTRSSATT